jgi:lipoprotein-releasing system ATP-binding protein
MPEAQSKHVPHTTPNSSADTPSPRASSDSPIVEAQNIYKTYRMGRVDVRVLRGASISVKPGEWVAVLGASGSGKSTLLHLLGGLDRPSKRVLVSTCTKCRYDLTGLPQADVCPECGAAVLSDPSRASLSPAIFFRGRSLNTMPQRELDKYRNESVGFVFQFYHLLPELNVEENVLVPAMARWGRFGFMPRARELRERASTLLKDFGLAHRLTHRPSELSGGERQRVAIARALINNPPLLLADEPTGNLDRKTGDVILDQIAHQRARDGRTLVMVTHDREVAARADRIVQLDDGRIV